MENIMMILGLVIVGLACIFAVGYILFRPVVTKDPFAGMSGAPEVPADDAEETEEEQAEAEEEPEEEIETESDESQAE